MYTFHKTSWKQGLRNEALLHRVEPKHPPKKKKRKKVQPKKSTVIPMMRLSRRVPGRTAGLSVEVQTQSGVPSLIDDLVHRGLLVSGTCHDVFVVGWNVAAQDGGRLLRLLDTQHRDVSSALSVLEHENTGHGLTRVTQELTLNPLSRVSHFDRVYSTTQTSVSPAHTSI